MPDPILGYRHQPTALIDLVNQNKWMEELLLRRIDSLRAVSIDERWRGTARFYIEMGFMALNRAILQPERVSLPDDSVPQPDGGLAGDSSKE